MLRPIVVSAVLALAEPSWAGCYNHAEGVLDSQPRAMICYQSECEETTIEYECGNIYGQRYGYANGLRIHFEQGENVVAFKDNLPIDYTLLTCKEIDEGACFPVQCKPTLHAPVPNIVGLAYPQARKALMSDGWQPYEDRDRYDRPVADLPPEEQWISVTGYYEIEACSAAGMGFCRGQFADENWAWLRVITEPGGAGDFKVLNATLVCGPD